MPFFYVARGIRAVIRLPDSFVGLAFSGSGSMGKNIIWRGIEQRGDVRCDSERQDGRAGKQHSAARAAYIALKPAEGWRVRPR